MCQRAVGIEGQYEGGARTLDSQGSGPRALSQTHLGSWLGCGCPGGPSPVTLSSLSRSCRRTCVLVCPGLLACLPHRTARSRRGRVICRIQQRGRGHREPPTTPGPGRPAARRECLVRAPQSTLLVTTVGPRAGLQPLGPRSAHPCGALGGGAGSLPRGVAGALWKTRSRRVSQNRRRGPWTH